MTLRPRSHALFRHCEGVVTDQRLELSDQSECATGFSAPGTSGKGEKRRPEEAKIPHRCFSSTCFRVACGCHRTKPRFTASQALSGHGERSVALARSTLVQETQPAQGMRLSHEVPHMQCNRRASAAVVAAASKSPSASRHCASTVCGSPTNGFSTQAWRNICTVAGFGSPPLTTIKAGCSSLRSGKAGRGDRGGRRSRTAGPRVQKRKRPTEGGVLPAQ